MSVVGAVAGVRVLSRDEVLLAYLAGLYEEPVHGLPHDALSDAVELVVPVGNGLVNDTPRTINQLAPGAMAEFRKDIGKRLPLVVILEDPRPTLDPRLITQERRLLDDFDRCMETLFPKILRQWMNGIWIKRMVQNKTQFGLQDKLANAAKIATTDPQQRGVKNKCEHNR